MPSDYVVDGAALTKARIVDHEHTVTFRAQGVRQERTGIHARVTITCDGADLAWSNFNVEKDEDRVRLTNSAHGHLNGMSSSYPKTHLKSDLDSFCAGLWDAQMAQTMPVLMEGSLESRPPSFVLYPFILSEGGTIIFAPPGRGKSYTLMLMAVSVDAGLGNLWAVEQTRVLFVNLERGARSVADRLGNINQALGLPRNRPIATINARGRSLMDVAPAIERYVRENHIGVIFVDSISRAGGGNLNDNEDVNRICDQLNRLGPAWVGLGHTPRNDESHIYGGVHFEAAADVVVQLLSEQDDDGPLGVGLQITKQNDVGRVPQWTMALEFSDTGLARVRNARPGEFPDVEANKRMTMREQVREHLREIKQGSASEIAEALGFARPNVSMLLNKDRAFQKVRRDGREVIFGLSLEDGR